MDQTFLHTLLSSLTNFLLDRCSTGPAIPGAVSHQSGNYRTTNLPPAGRCALIGHPWNADIALTGLPPTPRDHPTTSAICLPDIPELLSLHIYSQSRIYKDVRAFTVLLFYVSGLSPYRCYRCPGFHRTAVLLLSEQYTNRYPHGSH